MKQLLLSITYLWAILAFPAAAYVQQHHPLSLIPQRPYPIHFRINTYRNVGFPSQPPSIWTVSKELFADASSESALSSPAPTTSTSGGGTATISNEIFNLVKSIVGAGVLSLPYGIATLGSSKSAALPAVLLMTLLGICSGYGFGLIGRVCGLTNRSSYTAAWAASVSPSTQWLPALAVTSKTLCANLAYSMILADTCQALAAAAGVSLTKPVVLSLVTSTILLPLCLMQNLSSLAPFSLLGTLGMVYTAIAMGLRYVGGAYALPKGLFLKEIAPALRPSFASAASANWNSPSILLAMLSTAYMAHFNAPKFFTELKDNTVPRYMTVVAASFGIAIALFATIGTLGFFTFGAHASSFILNNYATTDRLMSVSRGAVAVSLIGSYPLAFVGARDGLLDWFGDKKNTSPRTIRVMTVAMLSALTVAALIIPDLSFVLAFAGATLGNALIYIFPGLMFRGAIRKHVANPTRRQRVEVKLALTSAVLGALLGVMGSVKAVQSIL
jgi:amino acid permease